MMFKKKYDKLLCPRCGNNQIIVYANFKNKYSDNIVTGECVRTAYSGFFGTVRIKGCGQTFTFKINEEKLS